MGAMTTSLTQFNDSLNQRTWIYTGHAAMDPRLVIQKRKVPTVETGVLENSTRVVVGTQDALGANLASKVSFEVIVRYPANGTYADVTAALTTFRDIVASDEFTTSVQTQQYLK
jgi:hypothetical protein